MLTIKRFEPECGLSRADVEEEARARASEVERHLLQPPPDLRDQLGQRGEAWNRADEALHAVVLSLPDGERLVVQWLLIGDLHRILEVYLECLRTRQPEAPAPQVQPEAPTPLIEAAPPVPRQSFNESLFQG